MNSGGATFRRDVEKRGFDPTMLMKTPFQAASYEIIAIETQF
jgi:hypothetical protein